MIPLLSLLLAPTALAQDDEIIVFVSEFQAVNKEAGGLAALLGGYLYSELEQHPELDAVTSNEAPDFGDYSATTYLLSCPPGEYLGCAYVVGDRVDAQYAVAGTVEALPDGTLVHVTIIDVWGSREAVSFDIQLEVGQDDQFAKSVAEMMVAVIEGEAGALDDIRDPNAPPPDPSENDAVAQQLEALAMEMGGVTALSTRSDRRIDRPEYTLEELTQDADTDAAAPWELLGMSPEEYLRFKNSGLTVDGWRKASAGRRGQLIVRVGGGMGYGPYSSSYRGWYAIDGTTQENVEQRAWQVRSQSTAYSANAWVGYGLTPSLEVDVGFGTLGGRYAIHIQQEIVGEDVTPRNGEDFNAPNYWVGARVVGSPFPMSRVRPLVGLGGSYLIGEGTEDNVLPGGGTNLPVFDASNLVLVQGLVGAELTLHQVLDVYVSVPLGAVVTGGAAREYQNGSLGNIQSYQDPPNVPVFTTGVEAGISVRLGGRYETQERSYDEDF